jgi:branched-subunit amino acid ABC-type transport system permease component
MDLIPIYAIDVISAIAMLALLSIGLAVVFGMMKIINLAHGDFMMLGGYVTILATNKLGVPIWISMLVLAPLAVGLFGIVVEHLIVRHLYGRMIDTMLATWGLSLAIVGLSTMIFGNTTLGISTPLGSVSIGARQTSGYTLFLVALACVVSAAVYAALRFTSFGMRARACMQNADMCDALGMNPDLVYKLTFGAGAALSGLAGAAFAPLSGVIPTIGAAYVAKAFITVICGGTAVVAGTLSASGLFGVVSQAVTFATTPVFGEISVFVAAIVLVRLLPQGITGRFFRRAS